MQNMNIKLFFKKKLFIIILTRSSTFLAISTRKSFMLGLLIKALRLIKAGPGPQINNSLSEVCKTMATETTLVPDRDLRIFYNTRSMVL